MKDSGSYLAKITIFLIIALLVGAATWASYAEIDEITRGEGKVIPATKTQTVQATEAGVVEEIYVQLGQVVKKGDLIVRLDDTTTASSLGESVARLRALTARVARLDLEQAGAYDTQYKCPEEVQKSAPLICKNEEKLLFARQENFINRLSVLEQRKLQREKELNEVQANINRLQGGVEIAKRELALLEPLVKKRLVAQTELIRAQRDLNENDGQLKRAQESVDRIKGGIEEANLQVKELGLQLQQESLDEKTQALAELSVLEETVRGGADRVARTDIRSPVDGVINTLAINTVGSFVQPGALIAEVVPTSDELLVETRISPNDVAFVRKGQSALVKITAYDFSIYGGLTAQVATVTADSVVDQNTGEPYFQVLVKTDKAYLENSGRQFKITPGMVSSVDIITGRKTILHYLLKPINKARQEALTER